MLLPVHSYGQVVVLSTSPAVQNAACAQEQLYMCGLPTILPLLGISAASSVRAFLKLNFR
jgi:hypothetical protein